MQRKKEILNRAAWTEFGMRLSNKCCKLTFLGLAVLVLFNTSSSLAATITVTSLADDGSPGTLRYAIANAMPGDTINFTVTGKIILTTGEIGINKSLTISGSGASSLSINGNKSGSQTCFCRVFSIGSGITANISGLTIENGSNFNGGGGLFNDGGTLILTGVTVSSNDAVFGGGKGGGIFNNGGTVMLINSTVTGNAAGRGGGIFNNGGTMALTNTTVSTNGAFCRTGIYQDGNGTLTLSNSTVASNAAGTAGGGIYNNTGVLTVIQSTVSGNSANYDGAGVYNDKGITNMANSTVAGNASGGCCSPGHGGGIFNNFSGTLKLSNTTLYGNSAT